MSRRIGLEAEAAAARFLQARGYEILARNYTIRGAEVDIIAREGQMLAFVEVKHRKSMQYAVPRESVNRSKRRRMVMAALTWMQENECPDTPVRFDIIESTPQGMTLLRGAFDSME